VILFCTPFSKSSFCIFKLNIAQKPLKGGSTETTRKSSPQNQNNLAFLRKPSNYLRTSTIALNNHVTEKEICHSPLHLSLKAESGYEMVSRGQLIYNTNSAKTVQGTPHSTTRGKHHRHHPISSSILS
tara:strand:+ start:127 stop:510 length:384 start_codon:yes stop_codon:yes gene_type:complete